MYLCAIVTSLEFEEYDKPYAGPRLCDPAACGVCARVCPVHALSADEGQEWTAGETKCIVGRLDVNGCAAACFGFHRSMNPMTFATVESDHPSDEELAAALKRQYALPGIQTLDHLPMFHCDKCMVYCPVGNWAHEFVDNGLTGKQGEDK